MSPELVKIEAFERIDRNTPAVKKMELAFQLKPGEGVEETYTIDYACGQALNSSGADKGYSQTKPVDKNFRFILNDNSIAPFILGNNVTDQIAEFRELCVDMNGNIHRPNYLRISWGESIFDCQLKELTIKKTHFDRNGNATRATLDATFSECEDPKKRQRREGKNSPDLTHVHVVTSGDTLPFLCRKFYGSPEHYLFVASANGLGQFRHLVEGQELKFPPLQSN